MGHRHGHYKAPVPGAFGKKESGNYGDFHHETKPTPPTIPERRSIQSRVSFLEPETCRQPQARETPSPFDNYSMYAYGRKFSELSPGLQNIVRLRVKELLADNY